MALRKLAAVTPEVANLIHALRANSKGLTREAARSLVRTYYQMQKTRILLGNRASALQRAELNSDHLNGIADMFMELEKEVAVWLDAFSGSHPVGVWARGQYGVGPVLAAGLLAALDMEKTPYVSSFWALCGLDPTKVWEKGKKAPHNPELKALCWKLGESFVKVSNNENAFYSKVYADRKLYEWAKNLRGEYADLVGKRNYTYGDDTESYKWTSGQYKGVVNHFEGNYTPIFAGAAAERVAMIPPQAIHSRAKRYAVKLFLSHFWQKSFEHAYPGKEAPHPWVTTYGGHSHIIPPPPVMKQP